MGEQNEQHITTLDGLYENWFLDYASYVILERAVPALYDGLKPVQRRIMHTMKTLDDGRFNKVANIVGSTMQYHPHGDASINEAIVNIGQKDLLIDCQGNWGDIRTGDSAAAARYIEARLSKFALEVMFNEDTTEWQLSYDGRKKEPVLLPVKFPLLLAQGIEGIAVGLSTKVMPHNFCELIDASIKYLKKEDFILYPDFLTGGLVDVREYNDGKRGGKIRVRAKVETIDKKSLRISEIPFGTTTANLIDSILKANEKGKIKIKKVHDNTAKDVDIQIELQPNISTSVAIDALYAFTDCELSISPNTCVIIDEKPHFTDVSSALKISTDTTVQLLKRELEILLGELQDKWHFSSLEKIFIENRIYRDIEEEETWEGVISAIDKGLDPFKNLLQRAVTQDDIVRLTEIKIKRISKFDAKKADEYIKSLEDEMAQTQKNLKGLTAFAIKYFENLLKKYGKGRERKTEITNFDTVEVKLVAANNEKLYVNRAEGFVGYGKDLKKEEFISECSDIDDIIAFTKDGIMKVVRNSDKVFIGKDIIHVAVWKKNDERTTYNAVYLDGKSGNNYVKRFNVTSITRDKEYPITQGNPKSKLLYFTANPNAEAEIIDVQLTQGCSARIKRFDYDFSELTIKNRSSQGNILTKYPVRKIELRAKGQSTLGGLDIWLDDDIGKLNTEQRGKYLGSFQNDDKILVLLKSGEYMLTNFELTNRYNMNDSISIEKYYPNTIISAIHYIPSKKCNYIKRFQIETSTLEQRFSFIADEKDAQLVFGTTVPNPTIEYTLDIGKNKSSEPEQSVLASVIEVKGWKAVGNKFVGGTIKSIALIESKLVEESTETKETINQNIDFEITNLKENTEGEQGELF
ncbi:MAG TPA: DNA gyrase/topoisomerase IV subunit A [Chitinophagales bacterium]|nr:DNA gyrase/topoisomerase IV subunit A [Chitinophagales bacterium]HMV03445.1 DNA gyrase/topoisomerase IV subunit A [Chitinophagales bacterium]HMW94922.1 DNA gyrase/topoisomerase IV subunit A [Chitinophagales bacterium]HMZ68918.1 DNA gyrase/topoisomerase IV subunit A [Chitinophagales bacterium]HND45349.1 DNA gyrase/topoisomerase IV subunit A [Chitinophagales bacterium]